MLTTPERSLRDDDRARLARRAIVAERTNLTVANVRDLRLRLAAARNIDELLAVGLQEARNGWGFARGVVLAVEGAQLVAASARAADDPASDELRRRVASRPVPLRLGTPESDAARLRDAAGPTRAVCSVLRDQLALEHFAVLPLCADGGVVALLVVDRPGDAVSAQERESLEVLGQLLGLAIEAVVLRSRLTDLGTELRHLTTSATALAQELAAAPISLASPSPCCSFFVSSPTGASSRAVVDDLLTAREQDVAALVAEGLSNREIGERLFLSADTAKMHVAALARKLDAANRAQVAARWTALQAKVA